MDTLSFLQAILPEHGIHYLALFKEGYKFPAHKVYADLETMADAINSMANDMGRVTNGVKAPSDRPNT